MANTPLGFPFGFFVADNSPIDGKYGVLDAGAWRPYTNIAEALAELPIGIRYIGLTVNINKTEYWWAEGVTNAHLVVKNTGAGGGGGISWKNPVRAATTANITLSGLQTIDGVSLIADDRVLVKNQTTQSANGIYVVASGAWARAVDADSGADLQNAVVSVDTGTVNADTTWRQSADGVTVGSSNIVWIAFGAAGISGTLTANRVPYATGASSLGDDAALVWDAVNKALTIGSARVFTVAKGSVSDDLFIGRAAGNFTTTGLGGNIGIGYQALDSLTTGSENVAIGWGAGGAMTTAVGNVIVGLAGNSVTGSFNTLLGRGSGSALNTGQFNTFVGMQAGKSATTGSRNIVIGTQIDLPSSTANGQLNIQNIIYGTGNTGIDFTASTGNIGIAVQAPTARFHLPGGTASANTAPLKLTSGTALTTPEDGALEYHSSHLYFTVGSTRIQLDQPGSGIGGLTTNRIPYATSPTTLGDDSALTWDATNNAITIDTIRIHRMDKTVDDMYVGPSAGNFSSGGLGGNTGIGASSITALTSGEYNTAVGYASLPSITTGSHNIAIGANTMPVATTANDNVVVGRAGLEDLTDGVGNVAIGRSAGEGVTTGDYNIFLGQGSGLDAVTTGSQNILIGFAVRPPSGTANGQLIIQNIIYGTGNTATGTAISSGNIGIAVQAPSARLHLPGGTASASTAPLKLTSGTALTTPEDGALEYHSSHLFFTIGSTRFQLDQQGGSGISGLTANRIPYATSPTTLGDDSALTWDAVNNALTIGAARIHSAGSFNTFIGQDSGNFTTTGAQNTAIGYITMANNTTGQYNTALGAFALANNTTGNHNTALGRSALHKNTTGSFNVAIGLYSMGLVSTSNGSFPLTANSNVGVGYDSLYFLKNGSQNIGVGEGALRNNTSGSGNVALGNSALSWQSSVVTSLGTIVGGSGYANGTYNNVTLTYSSGGGFVDAPVANITVSGGAVTGVTLVSGGRGADLTTVFTTAASSIGGTGSGFTVAVGAIATANNNIAIGLQSGTTITTGSNNIAIGAFPNAVTTGSNNISIGQGAGLPSGTANDQLNIQNIIYGINNSGTGATVSTGNIGIAVTAPSARLHLPAGSATANTAPLKLTSGTALTTPENGALEYHGSHLYFTIGSTRYQLDQQGGGGISGLTANRIPYATSPTTLGDDSTLLWDAVNNALTIDSIRIFKVLTDNMFIGVSAGNFTMTGNYNTMIGRLAGTALSGGAANTAIGAQSFMSATTGHNNTAIGYGSLAALTSGSENIAIGNVAGDNITTGAHNIIIGYSIDAPSATASNQLTIQNIIFGTGNSAVGTDVSSGNIGIGTPAPDRKFHIEQDSATFSAVTYVQRLTSTSSGTPANGIGVGIEFEVETSAGNNEVGATIEAVTTDVTSASEDFDMVFKVMAAGAAASEKLRVTSDGRIYGTALHNNAGPVTGTANQYIASGTYTPTLGHGSNVTGSTANVCQWIRVGNVVTVSGIVGIQATAGGGTFTALRMSLPIASDLITVGQCAGTHNQSSPTENAGVVYSEISSNMAEFGFAAVSTASLNRLFTFTYLIS